MGLVRKKRGSCEDKTKSRGSVRFPCGVCEERCRVRTKQSVVGLARVNFGSCEILFSLKKLSRARTGFSDCLQKNSLLAVAQGSFLISFPRFGSMLLANLSTLFTSHEITNSTANDMFTSSVFISGLSTASRQTHQDISVDGRSPISKPSCKGTKPRLSFYLVTQIGQL